MTCPRQPVKCLPPPFRTMVAHPLSNRSERTNRSPNMSKLIATILLISASGVTGAQHLTPAQKQADLWYLASLFATYYAPLDWKKQLFGFDALDLAPWLDRAAK